MPHVIKDQINIDSINFRVGENKKQNKTRYHMVCLHAYELQAWLWSLAHSQTPSAEFIEA